MCMYLISKSLVGNIYLSVWEITYIANKSISLYYYLKKEKHYYLLHQFKKLI